MKSANEATDTHTLDESLARDDSTHQEDDSEADFLSEGSPDRGPGSSKKQVEFCDPSSIVVHADRDDTWGSGDEAEQPLWKHMRRGSSEGSSRPILRRGPSICDDSDSTATNSKKATASERRRNTSSVKSLTTASVGLQVFIPFDRDGTIELMQKVQEETEDELEELEQALRTVTAERDHYKRHAEGATIALQQAAAQRQQHEQKELSLNRLILQLNKELKAERKAREESGSMTKLMTAFAAMENRLTTTLMEQQRQYMDPLAVPLATATNVPSGGSPTAVAVGTPAPVASPTQLLRTTSYGTGSPPPTAGAISEKKSVGVEPPGKSVTDAATLQPSTSASSHSSASSSDSSRVVRSVPSRKELLKKNHEEGASTPNSTPPLAPPPGSPAALGSGVSVGAQLLELNQTLADQLESLRHQTSSQQQEILLYLKLLRKPTAQSSASAGSGAGGSSAGSPSGGRGGGGATGTASPSILPSSPEKAAATSKNSFSLSQQNSTSVAGLSASGSEVIPAHRRGLGKGRGSDEAAAKVISEILSSSSSDWSSSSEDEDDTTGSGSLRGSGGLPRRRPTISVTKESRAAVKSPPAVAPSGAVSSERRRSGASSPQQTTPPAALEPHPLLSKMGASSSASTATSQGMTHVNTADSESNFGLDGSLSMLSPLSSEASGNTAGFATTN